MRRVLLSFILGLAGTTHAAEPPAREFLRPAEFSAVKLSPTGDHVAVAAGGDDTTNLAILRLSDMKVTGGFRSGTGRHVDDFWWANDERVVMTFAEKWGSLDTEVLTGEMLAVNADGSRPAYLYGYKGSSNASMSWHGRQGTLEYRFAHMVSPLLDDSRHVLIATNHFYGMRSQDQTAEVYRLDVETGKVKSIALSPIRGWSSFLADRKGEVRFASGTDSKTLDLHTFIRDPASQQWRSLTTDSASRELKPLAISADEQYVFMSMPNTDGMRCLYRQSLEAGSRVELSCDPVQDLKSVFFASDETTPLAALYASTRPRIHWLDPEHPEAKLVIAVANTFPGQHVTPLNWSKDGSRLLLMVSSDKNPGDYYLLDTKRKKAQYLLSQREWIDPERMAARETLVYRSRDDTTDLHGYVTLPSAKDEKQAKPMVVIVHGGPFGILNSWFWDETAQLLANRGYVVFEPNFRGSGGLGREYQEAARTKWGSMMIEDIVDGTRELVRKGIADPSRICIYGGSYGAYASMMAAIREPDLYRCVIAYAGVYDLPELVSGSDIGDSQRGRSYLKMYLGTDKAELIEQSPVTHLDRLKAPVFIAHGQADKRTPFKQAKKLRSELQKRKHPYEWLDKRNEGHGFANIDNRVEFSESWLKFVAKHIGQAVPGIVAEEGADQ